MQAVLYNNTITFSVYMYMPARRGFIEKSRATVRFLRYKMNEYKNLQREIENLKRELTR